jgi:hypothetical protein
MAIAHTRIGERDVPIRHDTVAVVKFSGPKGNGKDESGVWEFWTAVCNTSKGVALTTVRCWPFADRGEGFRAMEGRPGYEISWATASNADYLRPSLIKDVEGWLNNDLNFLEAPYATDAFLEGGIRRVIVEGEKYRIVDPI